MSPKESLAKTENVNWISACRPHGNNPDWVTDSMPHRQHASGSNQHLPDHVMVALLEREKLLTQGKAHVSSFEAMMGERELRHLQSMIRQVRTQPKPPLATDHS